MPRFRFLPGLILGFLIGIVVGAMLPTVIFPPAQEPSLTSLKVQELTRELDASRRERDALNRQINEFQALANQMTAAFTDLERRFRALEEEMRLQQARDQALLRQRPPEATSPPEGAEGTGSASSAPAETPREGEEPAAP